MTTGTQIEDHWGKGDVYGRIVAALQSMSKPLDRVTVDDLAPVDHVHARGLTATIDLADHLPIKAGDHILDIGCGLGGPARYMARRFKCKVSGIDITRAFVDAANKLTALVGMGNSVTIEHGDGQRLPYEDGAFDGAYSQHVTMNVADRRSFYFEAHRVLKRGAFFALTEHGLGARGDPHFPVPWSTDGTGSHLCTPAETVALLESVGFADIVVEDTGPDYVAGYRATLAKVQKEGPPPLGLHLLLGAGAAEKTSNAVRNIEEGRTHPFQLVCVKR